MHVNFGWANPVMGGDARELYPALYGEKGEGFVSILEDCPPEVAVLSRLAAHLQAKWKGR